ncbi:site-specific integrase [Massilia terrae]|uniref:Site-specific integrase n=1 Tax=Massilia terrae TaxID=1811224 RepID=A0ABT2D3G9_9BURK|nr:site-specific integrase [Massilia terrae]MCS0660766.1 site-specific integrase [Massilia terrae]
MLSVVKVSTKRWKLVPYAGSETAGEIIWDDLDFEGAGTKHQRLYLKKSLRELLEALLEKSESEVGQLSPNTVRNKQRRLWAFASWMAKREIWLLSQLEEFDLIEYVQEIITRRLSEKASIRSKSISSLISFFRDVWIVRESYTAPIRIDPDKCEELLALTGLGSDLKRWSPVQLEVAKPLIQDALQWIETAAPLLNNILAEVHRRVGGTVGLTRKQIYRCTNQAYQEIARSEDYARLRQVLRSSEEDVVAVLRRATKLADGATIVLILFLTGVRISEARSLKSGCVTEERHDTGTTYRYINGIAAKKKGSSRHWVVPEVVVDAIALLEARHKSAGGSLENAPHLFRSFSGNGARARSSTRMTVPSFTTLSKLLVNFAGSSHRALPFHGHIHPHQGRKTFARFVMCRDKRALGALVQHYGHLYGAVLDGAYVGSDIELQEMLNEENRADLAEGLMDMLSGATLGGKGAASLARARKAAEATIKFGGRTSLRTIVDRMIEQGVKLAPCDWGYCLYEQDMSACRGTAAGPNPINRCPSTCSSCQNFAITEKFRGWWEERYRREEEFLQRTGVPEQTKVLVQCRLSESAQVLRSLNETPCDIKTKNQR